MIALADTTLADLENAALTSSILEQDKLFEDVIMLHDMKLSQAIVMARHVGGVYSDYVEGQSGQVMVRHTAVPNPQQERALKTLIENFLSLGAWDLPSGLAGSLAATNYGLTNNPAPIQQHIKRDQRAIIYLLTSSDLFARLSDSALYGGTLEEAELFKRLSRSIFENPSSGLLSPQDKRLQLSYIDRLLHITNQKFEFEPNTRAASSRELIALTKTLKSRRGGAPSTKEHRAQIIEQIEMAKSQDLATEGEQLRSYVLISTSAYLDFMSDYYSFLRRSVRRLSGKN